MRIFEMGLSLERGEFEKLVNQFLAAFCLIANVADKAGAVILRHVLVEKFGSSLDRGEGRLEFVGEGLDVTLGIVAPFERFAHVVEGIGEGVDLTA